MTTPINNMTDAVIHLCRAIQTCHARVDELEIILPAQDFHTLLHCLKSSADLISDESAVTGRNEFRLIGVLFSAALPKEPSNG